MDRLSLSFLKIMCPHYVDCRATVLVLDYIPLYYTIEPLNECDVSLVWMKTLFDYMFDPRLKSVSYIVE